jgi:hypothetical protein
MLPAIELHRVRLRGRRRDEKLAVRRVWRSVDVPAREGYVVSLDAFWVVPYVSHDGAYGHVRNYPER